MNHCMYRPAQLVEGKTVWYVKWYVFNPELGSLERKRKSFDLNRITSIHDRRRWGRKCVRELNEDLEAKNPDDTEDVMLIVPALQLAMDYKFVDVGDRTRGAYQSHNDILVGYLEARKLDKILLCEFSREHALDFLDYLIVERKIGARTYNNYVQRLKSLFYELLNRKILKVNPFVGIKSKKTSRKIRRAFANDEIIIMWDCIWDKNPQLMKAVALIFGCGMRPAELRRLRVSHIKYNLGVLHLPGEITKNGNDDTLTIPDKFLPLFEDMHEYGNSWYVFGTGNQPHPTTPVGKHTLNNHHKDILGYLYRLNHIDDITGLSLYSWKDTGAQVLMDMKVNIMQLKKHLRHQSITTTQIYLETRSRRNEAIAKWDIPFDFEKNK